MQTIYLDISNKGVIPTIHAKQGDVGRKFLVVLTDSGIPYAPPAGSVFSAWYEGDSGEGNYTDIGEKSAFSANGNKVTVEMIAQMLSNDGDGVLSLVLNDPNGNQISTWNIPYICEYVPGADSQEAKAYYTAFSHAVEKLPYPDASLSVSGKAADAAATGKALAGKAPAGYGLGEGATPTTDFNNACASGWYYALATKAANMPDNRNLCIVESVMYNHDWVVQRGYVMNGNYPNVMAQAIRYCQNKVWSEWEWINPTMDIGVEYRTTKRFNGMPVYTMAVDCGNMPSGDTNKSVEVYCYHTGWVHPVSCIGKTSIGTTIPIKFADGNEQWIGATKGDYEGHINIDMYGGVADWTATAIVEYVKL